MVADVALRIASDDLSLNGTNVTLPGSLPTQCLLDEEAYANHA